MTSALRRRSVGALFAFGALGYAWFAASVTPFSVAAYAVLAGPSATALVLYGVLGGFSPSRVDVTSYYRKRSSSVSLAPVAPWLVVALGALALESIALALGGRSASVPTLSTTIDHVLTVRAGRFALYAIWLAVGANPLRRLIHVQGARA